MIYFSSQDPRSTARQIANTANEILTLYFSGSLKEKEESVGKTRDLCNQILKHVIGNVPTDYKEIKQKMKVRFGDGADAKWNEYELACNRANQYLKTGKVAKFGIDHNARFVEWILWELHIIEKREMFKNEDLKYLDDSDFFNREDENLYKKQGKFRTMMFIRNAYRVEKYSKKIFGYYDMYVPLILERMAIEHYLKNLCEKNNIFGTNKDGKPTTEAPSKPAICLDMLEKRKLISFAKAQEFKAVLNRGNANTHEGYASYEFALVHGLEVLKYCFKEMTR